MTGTITQQIEWAIEQEDWKTARRLIEAELRAEPDDHWLLTRLSTTYYEQRDYDQALAVSERALESAPGCPLVRWDYAGALEMAGRTGEAIVQWKRLLKTGPNALVNDPCSEGREWVRSLLNDCRYRLGLAFLDQGEHARATRYLRRYLQSRDAGVSSVYNRDDAAARLTSSLSACP